MLFRGVAVVEEQLEDKMIGPHPWPRVLRLVRYVYIHVTDRPAQYSRAGVLRRDKHRCAYCDRHANTIDHVHPQSKGGRSEWLNTVAAGGKCDGQKANKTLAESGMRLLFDPCIPTRAQLAGYKG